MAKAAVEQFSQLRALSLQKIHTGTVRIETEQLNLGLRVWPNTVNVVWCWLGKRYAQSIERVLLPYAGKRGRVKWFKCPWCGRVTWCLYIKPGESVFRCRKCASVEGYGYWNETGRLRQPKTAAAWFRWLNKQANQIAKEG